MLTGEDRKALQPFLFVLCLIAAILAVYPLWSLAFDSAPSFVHCPAQEEKGEGTPAEEAIGKSIPAIASPERPNAEDAGSEGNKGSVECSDDPALAKYTWQLARYTLGLFAATILLGALGVAQLFFLSKSDKTAGRMASIALRQASSANRQADIAAVQTGILEKQKEIQRQEFLITHRPRLEVRFVRDVVGGIEITVINTGGGTAKFVAARAGIWHLLDGEAFPSPHDLLAGNEFMLRDSFAASESDRCTISGPQGPGSAFKTAFSARAHIFGWIVYETEGLKPVRRTTYFGRYTVMGAPELIPVEGSDWNFIQ